MVMTFHIGIIDKLYLFIIIVIIIIIIINDISSNICSVMEIVFDMLS